MTVRISTFEKKIKFDSVASLREPKMHKTFVILLTISFSFASQAKVSGYNIKSLSLKLKGGDYSGSYNNQPCSVSVNDNGGNGSGYSVRVLPSLGSENLLADFSLTEGQEGQVSDPTADSIGGNFQQSLTLVRKPDGSLYVRVSNSVNGETARGYCVIATR